MSEDIRHLASTVGILQDEVLRLSQAVTRLEIQTAGRAVRARDAPPGAARRLGKLLVTAADKADSMVGPVSAIALTLAGGLLSVASVVWMLQVLGVLQ